MTWIEDSCFWGCRSLKTIIIDTNIERIEEFAFYDVGNAKIHYKGTQKQWQAITKEGYSVEATVVVNHNNCWDNGVYIKKPTPTEGGTKELTCKVCGATKTVSVDPTYHTYGNGVLTVYGGTGKNYHKNGEKARPWHKYRNEATSIIIKPGVKVIGAWCFIDFSKVKTVEMADTVTKIDYSAFAWCEKLRKIDLSSNLTRIGEFAFGSCSMNAITIPDGVTRIERYVFEGCDNLLTLNIPKSVTYFDYHDCYTKNGIIVKRGNKKYSSINGVLFNKKKTKVLHYAKSKRTKKYVVPAKVNTIGGHAFGYWVKIKKLVIGKNVKKVESYAFDNAQINTIVIKTKKLKKSSLGKYAFTALPNKVKIDVPNSMIKKYTKLFRKKGLSKKAKVY